MFGAAGGVDVDLTAVDGRVLRKVGSPALSLLPPSFCRPVMRGGGRFWACHKLGLAYSSGDAAAPPPPRFARP